MSQRHMPFPGEVCEDCGELGDRHTMWRGGFVCPPKPSPTEAREKAQRRAAANQRLKDFKFDGVHGPDTGAREPCAECGISIPKSHRMNCSKLLPTGSPSLVWKGMGYDNGDDEPDPRDHALELAERLIRLMPNERHTHGTDGPADPECVQCVTHHLAAAIRALEPKR